MRGLLIAVCGTWAPSGGILAPQTVIMEETLRDRWRTLGGPPTNKIVNHDVG